MSEATEQLKAALVERLQRVRGNMSDSEFAALVDDIAHMAARLEEIDARALARRTPLPGTLKPPADAKDKA